MNKNLRRSVVALATAFACLGLMAAPASAHTHNATISGGTITATGTGVSYTGTLGGGTGSGCNTSLTSVVDHAAGSINITAFTSVGHFVLNGNHYVSTITRTASTAGTIGQSGTSGTINSATVSVNVLIRAAANNSSTNEDCIPATPLTTLCQLRVTIHLSGTYTHTGTGSIEASNTFSLNGTGSPITFGIGTCQVPFSSFFGGSVTIAGLTGHVTT